MVSVSNVTCMEYGFVLAFVCPCMESMKVKDGFLHVLSIHGLVFDLLPCLCIMTW